MVHNLLLTVLKQPHSGGCSAGTIQRASPHNNHACYGTKLFPRGCFDDATVALEKKMNVMEKPSERAMAAMAKRIMQTHGADAAAYAHSVSERMRQCKDEFGVMKWTGIAKKITSSAHVAA
jgi:hypothetical protein